MGKTEDTVLCMHWTVFAAAVSLLKYVTFITQRIMHIPSFALVLLAARVNEK